MTIYIVTQGEYSDYGIKAVFTDYEQAMLYAASHTDDYYEPCMIEEYEADPVKIDTNKEIYEKWQACFNSQYQLQSLDKEKGFFFKAPNVTVNVWKGGRYFVEVFLPLHSTKEKAFKVICDTFAKWRYEKQELIR